MAKATKAAREHAQELGIDLDNVQGTGSGGQITKEDVSEFSKGDSGQKDPEPQLTEAQQSQQREGELTRQAMRESTQKGHEIRAESPTAVADMQDSHEKQSAAIQNDGRDLPGHPETGPSGLAGENVVSGSQLINFEEENVADEQQITLAFNPDSGTTRLVHGNDVYEPGSEVSQSKFNELKAFKSDGVPIIDEDNSHFVEENQQSAVEEQAQSDNLNAEADQSESEEPQDTNSNVQESSASADENKEA